MKWIRVVVLATGSPQRTHASLDGEEAAVLVGGDGGGHDADAVPLQHLQQPGQHPWAPRGAQIDEGVAAADAHHDVAPGPRLERRRRRRGGGGGGGGAAHRPGRPGHHRGGGGPELGHDILLRVPTMDHVRQDSLPR